MAFLKILIGSIIFIFVVWFTLYFYGSQKKYIPYDHPVVSNIKNTIFIEGIDQFTNFSEKNSGKGFQFGLSLEVYLSSNNDIYAISKNVKLDRKSWYSYSTQEIEALRLNHNEGDIVKLDNVLAQFPMSLVILKIKDNIKDLDLIFSAFLKKHQNLNLENRVLVQSEFDVVLSSLKAQLPRWVYGTGSGDRTRLLMLSSLSLNQVYELKGDFYYFDFEKEGHTKLLNDTIRADLQNRFMPILIGNINTNTQVEKAIQLKPDAYITTNPGLLLSELAKR